VPQSSGLLRRLAAGRPFIEHRQGPCLTTHHGTRVCGVSARHPGPRATLADASVRARPAAMSASGTAHGSSVRPKPQDSLELLLMGNLLGNLPRKKIACLKSLSISPKRAGTTRKSG
jgi:hypothetical protein